MFHLTANQNNLLLYKLISNRIALRLLLYLVTGLVLVFTVINWMVIGSTLIGYQVSIAHGPSMKPSISNGDALLIRNVDVSQVELGDIVIMKNGTDLIAHRLIQKEDYSYNIFLLKTKGDANTKPEKWYIDHDDKIGSVVMRIPVIGYLLEFLDSTIGKIIVIELILFMMGLYLYQRKCESYTQNNS